MVFSLNFRQIICNTSKFSAVALTIGLVTTIAGVSTVSLNKESTL